jgi:3-isopropylmalate dehydrogenase
MCFRYSLGAPERAELLDVAIREALRRGFRTADIAGQGKAAISTVEITDRLLDILEAAS